MQPSSGVRADLEEGFRLQPVQPLKFNRHVVVKPELSPPEVPLKLLINV